MIRYRTDQRAKLGAAISRSLGSASGGLEWVYPSATDAAAIEPQGLAFLSESPDVLAHWKEFWPQTGTRQCWDAVARLPIEKSVEWVLIEAKASGVPITSRS